MNQIVVDGTSLYVAGSSKGVARINLTTGTLDTTFTQATGFDIDVTSLLLVGADLYVSGGFSQYRSVAAGGLAKIDKTTGVMDTTFSQAIGFAPGFGGFTMAYANSSLYVGGEFKKYKNHTANYFLRMNTSGTPE